MKRSRKSPAVAINPLVVDLSHHNDVADFGAVNDAGIAGIIHKATEGVGFTDAADGWRQLPSPDRVDTRRGFPFQLYLLASTLMFDLLEGSSVCR
jgi:hypothetical protein